MGLSPYNSMSNNPISNVDPNGDSPLLIGAAIGFLSNGIQNLASGNNFLKGSLEAAIIGAWGGGVSSAIGQGFVGATGITTAAGAATKAWGITTTAIQSANVSMGLSWASGGSLDNIYKAGLVGAASGAFTATGGFGLLQEGAKNGIANRFAYQAIGTAGRSIGNNWAAGNSLFSKVMVGIGPVNLTFGKGQKLLQWQNNIGNIVANGMGIANLATGGKVNFDLENMTPVYRGGLLGKIYANNYTDATGAHAVLGIERMSNKIFRHELHHIWQSRSMGDAFLLNYLLQGSQSAFLRGGFFGPGNYFEGQAYNHIWF